MKVDKAATKLLEHVEKYPSAGISVDIQVVVAEIKRLRKIRGWQAEIKRLRKIRGWQAEIKRLRKIRGWQGELLICYQMGRQPSAKCLDGMAAVRKAELEAAEQAGKGE